MSSSVQLQSQVKVEAPEFNEATNVVAKIQGQIGKIGDLFANVQQLISEIRGAQAERPDRSEAKYWDTDSKGNKVFKGDAFAEDFGKFQHKLRKLNRRLEKVYSKLGQAQAVLNKLQSQELPAAERRDAEKIKVAMESALKALEAEAVVIDQERKSGESSSEREGIKIEIRTIEKKLDIKLTDDPSFKDVIKGFALMAQIVGDPNEHAKAASTVRIPPGFVGGGLPPTSTP